ncbi:MAG: hypothetical protein ACLFUB_00575 [Cyclobacteriaceae bacterium]
MKKLIFFSLGLLLSFNVLAQNEDEYLQRDDNKLWDKISLGGNFNLQFGNITFIDISPMVGYRVTNRFTAGPGFTYRYLKFRGFEGSSIYGGRVFARHMVGRQFFAHGEYENLNAEFVQDDRLVRNWVPGLFLGGGIFQPMGNRGGVTLSALYNVMHDNLRSPYNSPWVINVGFML